MHPPFAAALASESGNNAWATHGQRAAGSKSVQRGITLGAPGVLGARQNVFWESISKPQRANPGLPCAPGPSCPALLHRHMAHVGPSSEHRAEGLPGQVETPGCQMKGLVTTGVPRKGAVIRASESHSSSDTVLFRFAHYQNQDHQVIDTLLANLPHSRPLPYQLGCGMQWHDRESQFPGVPIVHRGNESD